MTKPAIDSPTQSIWRGFATAIRPPEEMSPADFASKHRVLHPVYCAERPGRWDDTAFPYQRPIQNLVQEAVESGRRGVVGMKAGQGGGTDAFLNALIWLKVYHPEPILFMASTESVASEFGRERFHHVIKDCEPLRAKYISTARGDILTKRFVDGKIKLAGGLSVHNLQSVPYRFVFVDELDSLTESLAGSGDPMKLAEVRTDSFVGSTLLVAYAHPTVKERGAAKLFYNDSDQRRGFVRHASCGHEFWLRWEDVKCVGEKSDSSSYCYACPECGEVIPDGERAAMVRNVVYKSVLPPAQAKAKRWIGCHFSQLYYPGKSIKELAQRWIECGDDDNAKRVFWNKVLGEPFETKVKDLSADRLRALIVVKRRPNDPEFYLRGQVPPWVLFLTGGQDSRTKELHYSIVGWGLRRSVDGNRHLCGALVDWGEIVREYSLTFSEAEYHVFDDLVYRKDFPGTRGRIYNVTQMGHDIGYAPTQLPIIRYCRSFPNRAVPIKGAALTATSACKAPYAQWGHAILAKAGELEQADATSRALSLNTFMLKSDMFGWFDGSTIEISDEFGKRKVNIFTLPEDVDDLWLNQTAAEFLGKGKKPGEMVFQHKGPNHLADSNCYAYGCALNLDPFQQGKTADEYRQKRQARRIQQSGSRPDPSLG